MYTWLGGSTSSIQGVGIDTDGNAIVASLESGVPFTIADNWTLEPQAQLIWQRVDFDDTRDLYSAIDFQSFDAVTPMWVRSSKAPPSRCAAVSRSG